MINRKKTASAELYEIASALGSIADHLADSDGYVGDGVLLEMLARQLEKVGGSVDDVSSRVDKGGDVSTIEDVALFKNFEAIQVLRSACAQYPEWAKKVWDLAGEASAKMQGHGLN
jgi:hypothetical protein